MAVLLWNEFVVFDIHLLIKWFSFDIMWNTLMSSM